MKKINFLSLVIACFVFSCCSPSKKDSKIEVVEVKENDKESYTGYKYISIDDIELEKTLIADIVKKLGKTKLYYSMDGDNYSAEIHYYLEKEDCYISFSEGEFGKRKVANNVEISNTQPDDGESYKSLKSFEFNNTDLGGLRLDMTKQQFDVMFEDVQFTRKNEMIKDTDKYTLFEDIVFTGGGEITEYTYKYTFRRRLKKIKNKNPSITEEEVEVIFKSHIKELSEIDKHRGKVFPYYKYVKITVVFENNKAVSIDISKYTYTIDG